MSETHIEREPTDEEARAAYWAIIDANKRLAARCKLLRAALVDLAGVDGREELEQMDAYMRLLPIPTTDRAPILNAIHALLETLD